MLAVFFLNLTSGPYLWCPLVPQTGSCWEDYTELFLVSGPVSPPGSGQPITAGQEWPIPLLRSPLLSPSLYGCVAHTEASSGEVYLVPSAVAVQLGQRPREMQGGTQAAWSSFSHQESREPLARDSSVRARIKPQASS